MYKVLIRADGSPTIGMGHIMRCLSLAKKFRQEGYRVYFLSRYKESKEIISEYGFDVIPFLDESKKEKYESKFSYGNTKDLEIEKDEIRDSIKKYQIDVLIIDQYNVTQDFFLSLKPHIKIIAYIDDINVFSYPVDVVINGNITGEYINYQPYFKSQQFLLGPSYNLIRDEFKNIPKRIITKEVRRVFITTGGSDPFRITEMLIDIVRNETAFDEMEIHVIIGTSFQNKEQIKDKQRQYESIVIYEDVKQISKVMLYCDIALSSCGSTLYELCACGLPTLGFILADNQVSIAEKMDELGYIKSLGWHHGLKEDDIIDKIKALIDNHKMREQMVRKQQELVDGKGTERIISFISKMLMEK